MSNNNKIPDINPIETQEWLDALEDLISFEGSERAQFIVSELLNKLSRPGIGLNQAYINTISVAEEEKLPIADFEMQQRLESIMRWNAVMLVLKAAKIEPELGGHLATYLSSATLYEIGFNYFFRGKTENFDGDCIFVQGHASTGIYARAFLEGRITEDQMKHFRQEVKSKGLSSYPHPWLMPEFWQFPTVSMGLGAIQAIYLAQLLLYLRNRKLKKTEDRKIWVFCGDGEMDEPESLGAIQIASRNKLNNLIFVINCNLQRLDGPVYGNGKIIKELESIFTGAGWNVIKVLWGSAWDPLLADDVDGLLRKRMDEVIDGEYQNYSIRGGAYFREHFFGKYPELKERVAHMSDDELADLAISDGGHDPRKVYAAYAAAMQEKDRPTVILAKTIKGYGLPGAQGLNIAHQQKKAGVEDLKDFRQFFSIPVTDKQIDGFEFFHPGEKSDVINYLQQHRKEMGSYLPARHVSKQSLAIPPLDTFSQLLESSGDRDISTTMAFVRILNILLRDKNIGQLIVPIVPDESRTFGMEGMFRQIGIFSSEGQLYEPVDKSQVMYYREAKDGQYLEQGITEAGAMSSWIAAASSYSTNLYPLIPFYIFYSMFGFQRTLDLAWAAGDMRCRGFLLGATSGRTTLAGEGLQHDDGQSHIFSSVVPNCKSYDPTFSYELAVIIHDGLKRMYVDQEDVYYYITIMNENYRQPAMPKGVEEGIVKGMYLYKRTLPDAKIRVQLVGSGAIFREVLQAAILLEENHGIGTDIWSVTSFTELRKDALSVERYNLLHPEDTPKIPYVTECLQNGPSPVIAATDYIRAFADQIRAYVPHPYYVLGTDGFGRSDTRINLRRFFEVCSEHIAYTTIKALVDEGQLKKSDATKALQKYEINIEKPDPWKV